MNDATRNLSQQLATTVESVQRSVVRIEARPRHAASGVVWAQRVILAADHTIEEEGAIRVGLHDGRTVTASVAGREPGLDLAVLKVEDADLVPPAWIDHDALRVGHLVLAVGRPGKTARAALGILSALGEVWRTPAGGRVECYVQPDLALHPGFSGSLLVDVEGRALGMNSSGLVRGTAVALPTVTLRRVIDDLLAHGNSQRGFLGIGTIPVRLSKAMTEKVGRPGALLVVSVQSGSPAERAGMLLGDVLVRLGDKPIGQVPELLDALEDVRAGAQATAHVLRGGEPAEFAVTVGARTE